MFGSAESIRFKIALWSQNMLPPLSLSVSDTAIDIVELDSKIRAILESEIVQLPEYEEKLESLEKSLTVSTIRDQTRRDLETARAQLIDHITDLRQRKTFTFYVMDTVTILDKYKEILKTPMKVNFVGKSVRDSNGKRKLVQTFLETASRYVFIEVEKTKKPKDDGVTIRCNNCPNTKDFDALDNNMYVCNRCFSEQTVIKYASSYTDADRVNISTKFMYDRRVHFRECMNQYQGFGPSSIFNLILMISDLE